MKRFAISIVVALALTCRAFDAAPLIQFCVASSASANWWDGLNLTAVWTLSEAYGTNSIDKIQGIVGVHINSPQWSSVAQKSALYFNGTNSYIDCGNNLNIGTNGLVLSAWIFKNDINQNNYSTIMGKYGSVNSRYIFSMFPGNQLGCFWQMGATGYAVQNGNILPTNQWIHVAMVLGRATNSTYLATNGVFSVITGLDTSTYNSTATGPFRIGSFDGSLATGFFKGYIRDAAIKVGGTSNDVALVYQSTRATYGR